MIMDMRKENGVTMVALVITVIVLFLIVSVIQFGARNGVDIRELNNMYSDILSLEDKVALYYWKYGVLPADMNDPVPRC